MIALQIALSNLTSTVQGQPLPSSVAFRFGGASTAFPLQEGRGGKCLYLDIDEEQLSEWYQQYAFGLYIQSITGNCFCLLSLRRLSWNDSIICQEVAFLNESRVAQYRGELSFNCKPYQQPKIPNLAHIADKEKALDLLKKPAVPKQPTKQERNKKSFLYGKQPEPTDHLKTLKKELRQKNKDIKQLQKKMGPAVKLKQKEPIASPHVNNEEELFDLNPPAMEFTNEQSSSSPQWKVPQVEPMESNESMTPTQPRFSFETPADPVTFNRKETKVRSISPQTPQSFNINKGIRKQTPKQKGLSRKQITQMAIREVEENHLSQDQVKIPILHGNSFEMVPLSSLSPEQIVQYVQRQRKVEDDVAAAQKKKEQLLRQEKELEQQKRRLAQQVQRMEKNQQDAFRKRPSVEFRHSAKESIKQQEPSEPDEYDDDFESISGTNSAIRSRLSSRVQPRKEEESMEEYSVEFDSYAPSLLTKSQTKNQGPQSNSDYSESFASYSQSFRNIK